VSRVTDKAELKFDAQGLIVAVVQDRLSGQVRMVGWMNQAALDETLRSRRATFFSRSRGRLWTKGESSGNTLEVREVYADCDADTLLVLVDPIGPTCHTGRSTCLFRELTSESELEERALEASPLLERLEHEILERVKSTAQKSYTRSLLDAGVPRIAAKIEEEAAELCQALAQESDERVASEAADLLYHVLVGLRARNVAWRSVLETLAARVGRSGHDEKAARRLGDPTPAAS
jgi:phosphoribosyl-AMP cyclohydrolase / phosphoribosyl-ATP pyrophosphohydrolase